MFYIEDTVLEKQIGECKFRNAKFSMGEFKELKDKYVNIAGKTFYYLFSKTGFTKELIEYSKNENIYLISLGDLEKL